MTQGYGNALFARQNESANNIMAFFSTLIYKKVDNVAGSYLVSDLF